MSSEISVAKAIGEMVEYFMPHCSDIDTLAELKEMSEDSKLWRKGHDLFRRIRTKTQKAYQQDDRRLQYQYSFEEICAKTFYNLSGYPAPFDGDSPFWVIPRALDLATHLQLDNPLCMASILQPKRNN